MIVVGIDLSGPCNTADTCLVAFRQKNEGMEFLIALEGAEDAHILELVTRLASDGQVVIGMDAPLSYHPGGGDRPADKALRNRIREAGGGVGVMTPTMTRMVYLTLRGVHLTRGLEALKPRCRLVIVEVHPGACLLLRGAPAQDVAAFKREVSACRRVLAWLETKGMKGIPQGESPSDHLVAACAAALGAWGWALGKPVWCFPAQPPEHPYDFAC